MKLLYIGQSPIQNSLPYQIMQQIPAVQQTVLYITTSSVSNDKEAITRSAFTHDLLSGYNYVIANHKWTIIGHEIAKSDVVVCYGHHTIFLKLSILLALLKGKKLILTTDAVEIRGTVDSSGWKLKLFKPIIFKILYNWLADAVFVPSSAALNFLVSIGVMRSKICLTPYVINEKLFQDVIARCNRYELRREWLARDETVVFVFCAKFIERKRPQDVINAFAGLQNQDCILIMIGDGQLMPSIRERIRELGLETKIFLLGIVEYRRLPEYYYSSDILVFCSDHEPYGLPVNEAMLCGLPVIVSDSIGARLDLVEENSTGWIYKTGNIKELSDLMDFAAANHSRIREMGQNARRKMTDWSSLVNVTRQVEFFKKMGWLAV